MYICIMQKRFNQLTGFNANKFVAADHVFIPGEGCFYETKEKADKANRKTGNEVGLYFVSILHEGVEIYKQQQTNVWN